jgi:radical SAM-linked protein
VTGYVRLPDNAKTAMAIVAAADYRLTFKNGFKSPYSVSEWQSIIKELFDDQPEFTIIKKTKKSEREVDLKPLVYAFEVTEAEDGSPSFFLQVSTGSIDNIKPELVLASLYEKLGVPFEERVIQIHRLEVYTRNEAGKLVPLLELGEEIK